MSLGFINNWKQALFKKTSGASLGLFRMLIGLVLFAQILWFIKTDFLSENVFDPVLRFKFYYFNFLEPLSKPLMKIMMMGMLVSALFISIGRFLKISSLYFLLSFTYLWLLDKSYFNNHYYFISLLVFLLMFTNADCWGSLSRKKQRSSYVPHWQILIIKFQIFILFFIAGVNKINTYWIIDYQPIKHILETKAALHNYDWLTNNFAFAFFSWSGLIFDLLIGFLVWSSKTRKYAFLGYIIFNLLNFWLFYDIGEIGLFPFLLLACLSIFIDPKVIEGKMSWIIKGGTQEGLTELKSSMRPAFIVSGLGIYVLLQVLLPFRHLLYNNHVDYTGKGQRFSWRMKIMYKEPDMHFYLVEEGSTEKMEVNVGNFLTTKQYTNLIYYPDFIPTVAKYIKEEGMRRGLKNPRVLADFKIGFMGYEKQYLVNPELDLSQVNYLPFENSDWILPLEK